MPVKNNWGERPLDESFLIDSGLLFEINRTVLHPLGIGLAIRTCRDGRKNLEFKDLRTKPEAMTFPEETYINCQKKLTAFMEAYGSKQLDLRRRRIGIAYQSFGKTLPPKNA